MWKEIRELLANIEDYPYDLYVTMVEEDASITQDIKAFKPDTKIKIVENRGYDIGPFIDFLHDIDLDKYDLVLKIHTKNKAPGPRTYMANYIINRPLWAKLLTHSLLGSPKQFKKNIMKFEKNDSLGMIGSKYLILSNPKCSKDIMSQINQRLEEWGYQPVPMKFIAGTMFMCRAKLLEPIKNSYRLTDFEPTDGSVRDGTLAHVMERLFGCAITAQGYKIEGCGAFSPAVMLRKIYRFLYVGKQTKSGYHLIKICKLPVYWHKVS